MSLFSTHNCFLKNLSIININSVFITGNICKEGLAYLGDFNAKPPAVHVHTVVFFPMHTIMIVHEHDGNYICWHKKNHVHAIIAIPVHTIIVVHEYTIRFPYENNNDC